MMRQSGILVGGLLLLLSPVWGQQVDLLNSTQEPFKETVKLQVSLGSERQGYVIFYIDGEFRTAVAYPYAYTWDTKQERDGEHKVLVIGHDSAGDPVGEKEFTVQVQNILPATVTPRGGILLRVGLRPEEMEHYHMQSEGVVSVLQGEAFLGNARRLTLETEVWWQDRVLFVTSDNQATVRRKIKNGRVQFAASSTQVRGVARGFTLIMDALGHVRPRRESNYYGYGDISLVFPERPVRLGDSWRSDIRIIPEVETQEPVKLPARHTLEAIEWVKGYRCARIRSVYDGDVTFNLRVGNNILPVTARTEGQRVTYWSYEEDRLVKAEDEATHNAEVDAAALGVQTGGAGMPGTGGFGGPPGLPGGGFGETVTGPPGGMYPGAGMPAGMGSFTGPDAMAGMMGPYGGGMPGGMPPFSGGAFPGAGMSGMPPFSGGAFPGGAAPGQGAAGAGVRLPGNRDKSASVHERFIPPADFEIPTEGTGSTVTRQKNLPSVGGGAQRQPGTSGGAASPYGGAASPYGGAASPYGGAASPYGGAGMMPSYGGMGGMPPFMGMDGMGGYPGAPGAGAGLPGAGGATQQPQTIRVQYRVKLLVELEEGDEIGPPQPRTQTVASGGRLR